MHGVRNQALAICQASRQTKNWCTALWAFPARLYSDSYESFAARKDYMSSLKSSSVSANCYKNTRLAVWERCGWMVAMGGGLGYCKKHRYGPCRNTNSSVSERLFREKMLFYRCDKLQVSFVALVEQFRAAFQLAEWEPELWLTAAPDRARSPRSAIVISALPIKMSVCSAYPTLLTLFMKWWWLFR